VIAGRWGKGGTGRREGSTFKLNSLIEVPPAVSGTWVNKTKRGGNKITFSFERAIKWKGGRQQSSDGHRPGQSDFEMNNVIMEIERRRAKKKKKGTTLSPRRSAAGAEVETRRTWGAEDNGESSGINGNLTRRRGDGGTRSSSLFHVR